MSENIHIPQGASPDSFMTQAGIRRDPPFFNALRENDWRPHFHWEKTTGQAADAINVPHEDYPRRTGDTERALICVMTKNQKATGTLRITQQLIRDVHSTIFPDHGTGAGRWRHTDVRVGSHRPPRWEFMDQMMAELEQHYINRELHLQDLRDWYFDFETIHPFRDGNGRVGGTIIAALSFPVWNKFLTPGQ